MAKGNLGKVNLETMQRWSVVNSLENMRCLGWPLGFSEADHVSCFVAQQVTLLVFAVHACQFAISNLHIRLTIAL